MADVVPFPGNEPPDPEAVTASGIRIWSVTCERELGEWTIRVNGCFVFGSWRAKPALNVYSRLMKALTNQ